jgi:ABC-type transport system involved in cytochrome c biogenesis permease component
MNKLQKISAGLFITSLLITQYSLLAINPAFAYDYKQGAQELAQGSPIKSPEDIYKILGKIVRYTYEIFFIVAVLFILIAAYNFLFARGDPEKVKSARSQVLYAAIAIAVAFLSVGAEAIIKDLLSRSTAP